MINVQVHASSSQRRCKYQANFPATKNLTATPMLGNLHSVSWHSLTVLPIIGDSSIRSSLCVEAEIQRKFFSIQETRLHSRFYSISYTFSEINEITYSLINLAFKIFLWFSWVYKIRVANCYPALKLINAIGVSKLFTQDWNVNSWIFEAKCCAGATDAEKNLINYERFEIRFKI